MKIQLMLIAAAAVLAPATASAATTIQNGGFELPIVGGSCCITSPPTSIPFWSATDNVNVVNGTFASSPFPTNLAYEGKQYLDLIGEGLTGSISQTFNTVAGNLYRLTFAYSHNVFGGSPGATASYTLGALNGVISHTTGSDSNLDWQIFSSTFVGTGSPMTLNFTNLTGQNNAGILLDGVSVSAAPEPATWGMMMLGFGFVGGAMRSARRRKLATVTFA